MKIIRTIQIIDIIIGYDLTKKKNSGYNQYQ